MTTTTEKKLPIWWIIILAPTGILLTSLFFMLVGSNVASIMETIGIGQGRMFSLLIYNSTTAVAVLIYYLLLKKEQLNFKRAGFRGKLTLTAIGWSIGAATIAVFLFPLISSLATKLNLTMFWEHIGNVPVKQNTIQDIFLGILTTVILAPLTEDTIFRGYILQMFLERTNKVIAVIISSLIFAAIHFPFFGPGLTIYMFFWTILSCVLYIRFKQIYPSMIFHMTNNFWAYIIVPMIFK